jgi:hypothetical protein
MGEELAVLVHRAALNRNLRPQTGKRVSSPGVPPTMTRRGCEAAADEIVEHGPPGRRRFSAQSRKMPRRIQL